jgi:hypothetical protein
MIFSCLNFHLLCIFKRESQQQAERRSFNSRVMSIGFTSGIESFLKPRTDDDEGKDMKASARSFVNVKKSKKLFAAEFMTSDVSGEATAEISLRTDSASPSLTKRHDTP